MRGSIFTATLLVVAAWGQTTQGGPQVIARIATQPLMSPEEVASAESEVQANPEDLKLRLRLLTYYRDMAPIPPNDDPIKRSARLRHILYLIEHGPNEIDPSSPLVYVFRSGGPYADAADHELVRSLWMRQADSYHAQEVLNAARFLFVEDKQDAEQLLKRAVDNAPANQRLAANLGFLYAMQILGLDNFAGDITAVIPGPEREQGRQRATSELENSSNPAVLAGAGTAIPNLAIRASRGRPVDPELFQFSSKLMAKARSLAPSDEAFRGPMPMIGYFQEAQALSNNGAISGRAPILKAPLPPPPNSGGAVSGALIAGDRGSAAVPSTPTRIRVPGDVQKGKLIVAPQPGYPELARNSGIEGDVHLAAVIGRDGTILTLQTISGHPLLIPAALDAVKEWRYQPTLLNGDPVEVATEIVVSFPPK